jgi:ribosomal protein S18 acetylase RimI-like enzyme
MSLRDLREIHSRFLEPLFDEEARAWNEVLHWDYRNSIDLIRRFIDAGSLAGVVAVERGRPAGYGFYIIEEQKGLIGGLFVSPQFSHAAISGLLLDDMLPTMRSTPHIRRIEAQIMPFGASFEPALTAQKFVLYPRQFMLLSFPEQPSTAAPLSSGLLLDRWNDRAFAPGARLMRLAYCDHVDGQINDQYGSEAGAMKFLRNIVVLPGCGQFLPEASWLLRMRGEEQPVGMVLTSRVAEGVAHTTQICVLPGYQGHGLGRILMEASIRALRAHRYRALSLTVTSMNLGAIRLYQRLGFRTLKTFSAAVWRA